MKKQDFVDKRNSLWHNILKALYNRKVGHTKVKSNMRIFKDNGITAKGNILPLSEFRLFREFKELKIDDEKAVVIIKNAERYYEEGIKHLSLSLFRDMSVTGSRSRFEDLYRERRYALLYMTLAEYYEGKGRFIERIADLVWAIMEESSWVIPAHMGNSLTLPGSSVPEIYTESAMPGLDLYGANCCEVLAVTKFFLGDKLDEISPIIGKKMDHLIYLRGFRPFLSGYFWWMSSPCNWVTNIVCSILTAVAFTVTDMDFREQLVDRAMYLLDNFTSSYPEDGCCAEGPGYWQGAAGSVFDCLELLDDMSGGKITLWDEPIIKNMCNFITTMNVDGRYFVNFEDCRPRISIDGAIVKRMGEKLNERGLVEFGQTMDLDVVEKPYMYWFAYRVVKDTMTPVVREAPKVTAKLATWLEGHKIAVFREKSDTSRGLFLAIKGGTNQEPGNHNDVGCIVISKDGKPVIVDPGIGSYDNKYFSHTERYMRWFTNASYHSCPTVNGIDQQAGNFYSQNEIIDTHNRFISMDICKAYPSEAGITSLVRSAKLSDGEITLTDDVKLDSEGDISFHFTCRNKPEIILSGLLDVGEGVELSFDKSLALEIEKVENKCLPYDDLNFEYVWGVKNLWRVKFTVKAKEFSAKFVFSYKDN